MVSGTFYYVFLFKMPYNTSILGIRFAEKKIYELLCAKKSECDMKRKMYVLAFLTGLFVVVAGCNREIEHDLTIAEECMETQPDSAYRCLERLERINLSGEQRAWYALLKTQAMHKCRIPLGNDSLINVAVAYYAESDDRHRLAKSLLYKGLVHKQNHQVEQAAEAFVESEHAFEGVEDDQYKALLFNHYASLLMGQNMYEESLDYYKKSYHHKLSGDSLHYIVSACGQIAKMFELLEKPDSAKSYYERGLSYADSLEINRKDNYYLLLHNYAAFLMRKGEFSHAEHLLKECADHLEDSTYRHTLHSALTTLYYKKGEYQQAIDYGMKVLESGDSLTRCGGYLRLYKIYKDVGKMDSAFRYHNLYRRYHSDIAMRSRAVEVATVPLEIENRQLAEDKSVLYGWKRWLLIFIVVMGMAAIGVYTAIRRKHQREQQMKDRQLREVNRTLGEKTASLGRVIGSMNNQTNSINRMKMEQEKILKKYQEEIDRLKETIERLEADICALKKDNSATKRLGNELKHSVKELEKQLKIKTEILTLAEREREINQRIKHFMENSKHSVAVDLLLQLKQEKKGWSRYDIKVSEYLPLLKTLLESESPELHARLEQSGLEWKKLTMCYLMALGLDDVGMMSQAACLAPNSVKAYRKECRQVLEAIGQE